MEGGQLFIIAEQCNCEQFSPLPKHLTVLSENLNKESITQLKAGCVDRAAKEISK